MSHDIARVTNERTILRFARISLRARAAIERAGGDVVFDRRSRAWLATMPEPSDWHPGVVCVVKGRPYPQHHEYEVGQRYRETVYFWRRPVGQCVLVSDEQHRLWHWRDPECPWALPF